MQFFWLQICVIILEELFMSSDKTNGLGAKSQE